MASKFTPSEFPGFSNLFAMRDPVSNRAFRAVLDFALESDPTAMMRSELPIPSTLSAGWAMGGGSPQDVVWTTSATVVLLSPRVMEFLHAGRFTGWRTVPCTLRDKAGNSLEYYFLVIVGRCGPIDYTKGEIVRRQSPGGVFPYIKGISFDPLDWDRSDFFVSANGTAWKFVTAEERKTFKTRGIKNIEFQPMDEIEISARDVKG